jgi:hypothetical protein
MTERSSPPDASMASTAALDPDLLALPAPPRAMRTTAVMLLATTAAGAVMLTAGLVSDARYAFAASSPEEVGELAALVPSAARENTFVTAVARLDGARALRYGRTTESDTFELRPVAGNNAMWVELRLPRGTERLDPAPVFVGRLVPMESAAFRYRGLGRSEELAATPIPRGAWVLIDGATPASYRWTVALAALLVLFAGYSVATIRDIVRRVRR